MAKNIPIKNNIQFDATIESTRIDIVILWPDIIARGTNPLIGHSIVLKKIKNNIYFQKMDRDAIDFVRNSYVTSSDQVQNQLDSNSIIELPIACAVLGIVPAC